jgi:hypothetical protein
MSSESVPEIDAAIERLLGAEEARKLAKAAKAPTKELEFYRDRWRAALEALDFELTERDLDRYCYTSGDRVTTWRRVETVRITRNSKTYKRRPRSR